MKECFVGIFKLVKNYFIIFLFIGVVPLGLLAQAEDQRGMLSLETLVLRPQFQLQEPSASEFSMGESLFALQWLLSDKVKGRFAVGPKSLLGTSARYSSSLSEEISFIEAYGEMKFDYGQIRAGLVPLGFGFEGGRKESQLLLGRSLLFQKRVVPLRDLGFGFLTENGAFFTQFLVHNGESGPDQDGQPWLTAKWGRRSGEDFVFGVSATTGSTRSVATSSSQDTLAGVNTGINALWRWMGPYLAWKSSRWEVVAEGYWGELEQRDQTRSMASALFSATRHFKDSSIGFRYDYFDPHHRQDRDAITQLSAAFCFGSQDSNSKLLLLGQKNFEQGAEKANDELRIIWVLTPQVSRDSLLL